MPAPATPPRIRTDSSNPFAHHTLAVRVPAIFEGVLTQNAYEAPIRDRVLELRDALSGNLPLPELTSHGAGAETWRRALTRRSGESWLGTDWFFAETYAYRKLVDATGFWENQRDPFLESKREEYASPAHAEALERALELSGSVEERLHTLLGLALFGNRIDLSFAASREYGTAAASDDLLADDRDAAVRALVSRAGPVHVICDNAGTELTLDLVLVDFLLETLGATVVLHLKVHPTFVSDATERDVRGFILGDPEVSAGVEQGSRAARAFKARLAAELTRDSLRLTSHPYWNGPESLWDLPAELGRELRGARLVILKGDANYRRAVGDALWPATTPFAEVTSTFPAPLLALRTLKSDPIVGLAPGLAAALDASNPTWRVNGKRGVASLGGGSGFDLLGGLRAEIQTYHIR